jgi:hypothetical protein
VFTNERIDRSRSPESATTLLATPDYVMNSGVNVVTCPATTITKHDGTTIGKDVPATPVYWEPGYANNWKAFIKAAITKYQGDPRISYIRFGTGAGGESGIMVGADSSQTCLSNWNAVGMNYTTWLNYTKSIVDYVASLRPGIPISFGVNDLGYWDQGTLGFAYALGAEAAKYRFNVGNSGYDGFTSSWNKLYQVMRLQTVTHMQTANPQLTGKLPTILQDAGKLSMQVYELYPDDYEAAYYPSQGGYGVTLSDQTKAALKSIGMSKSYAPLIEESSAPLACGRRAESRCCWRRPHGA